MENKILFCAKQLAKNLITEQQAIGIVGKRNIVKLAEAIETSPTLPPPQTKRPGGPANLRGGRGRPTGYGFIKPPGTTIFDEVGGSPEETLDAFQKAADPNHPLHGHHNKILQAVADAFNSTKLYRSNISNEEKWRIRQALATLRQRYGANAHHFVINALFGKGGDESTNLIADHALNILPQIQMQYR